MSGRGADRGEFVVSFFPATTSSTPFGEESLFLCTRKVRAEAVVPKDLRQFVRSLLSYVSGTLLASFIGTLSIEFLPFVGENCAPQYVEEVRRIYFRSCGIGLSHRNDL